MNSPPLRSLLIATTILCPSVTFGVTYPPPDSNRFVDIVYAKDYGMVCNVNPATLVGTDDTVAFAAAIAAAQSTTGVAQTTGKKLILPSGGCLTGAQTITGQINIEGSSSAASVLYLKSGVNAPVLTVTTTGYNFPADGHPAGELALNNFRISSVDGKALHATYPLAAGVYFNGGAWRMFAHSDHLTVYNMPGNGISGNAFGGGFVNLNWLYSHSNGGYGVQTNSTNDWIISHSSTDSNALDGVQSSGDTYLYLDNHNSFSNAGHGIHIFGGSTVTLSGHNSFDRNGFAGMYLNAITSAAVITISGQTTFIYNSQNAANSWSAITQQNAGAGTVLISGVTWPTVCTISCAANTERFNIDTGTSTTQFYCTNCTYTLGVNSAWVISVPAQLHSIGTNGATGWEVTGTVALEGGIGLGANATSLTTTAGAMALSKMTASASAPGALGGKVELVCGTNAGTAKLVAYAGTSGTAVTILDNIGSGVTGC